MKIIHFLGLLLLTNISHAQVTGIEILGALNQVSINSDYFVKLEVDINKEQAKNNFEQESIIDLTSFYQLNSDLNCGSQIIMDDKYVQFEIASTTNADNFVLLSFIKKDGAKLKKMSLFFQFDRNNLFSTIHLYIDFFKPGIFEVENQLTDCHGKKITIVNKTDVKKLM